MLTGDKGETAQSIGISCGLIEPNEHHTYKIETHGADEIQSEIKAISESVQKMTVGGPTTKD
jgi:magnesium-transporting ATPase (P-type)